jgi:hypothetical protein
VVELNRLLLFPKRPPAFGHRQTGELLDIGQAIGRDVDGTAWKTRP